MILEAAVEHITMYMAVELETIGGTPIAIISGLKIEPPPKPRAPLTQPPTKAKKSNRPSCLPLYRMSESTIPRPTFCLRAYSLRLIDSPSIESVSIEQTKIAKIAQSAVLHFCSFRIEGFFLLPRRKLATTDSKIVISAIRCFVH